MKRLIIHIGYPKAASTTLQNGMFLNLHKKNAINFLGCARERGYYGSYADLKEYKAWLNAAIDPSIASEYGIVQAKERFPSFSEDKVNVYSEGLFMTNEGHETDIIMPRILSNLFSNKSDSINILIVIRCQIKLLMSYYVQNYSKLKKSTFMEFFLDCDEKGWTGRSKIFDFYNIATKYAEIFGKKRVHLVLFEDMIKDLTSFSDDIAKVMDVDCDKVFEALNGQYFNKTKIKSGFKIVKKIDPLSIRGILKRIAGGCMPGMQKMWDINVPPLKEDEKYLIQNTFKDSNYRLADSFQLDKKAMSTYGYF
jgi:hypothetical protein